MNSDLRDSYRCPYLGFLRRISFTISVESGSPEGKTGIPTVSSQDATSGTGSHGGGGEND